MGLIRNGIAQLVDQAERSAFVKPPSGARAGAGAGDYSEVPPPIPPRPGCASHGVESSGGLQLSRITPHVDARHCPPIVIPQGGSGAPPAQSRYARPFVDVYVPQLQQYGIDRRAFAAFLEQLNAAFVGNQALGTAAKAGGIAGFAPSMIVSGIGMGVQLGSTLASAGTSVVRTRNAIQHANQTLFAPHGLIAYVCNTQNMLAIVVGGGGENAAANASPTIAASDAFHGYEASLRGRIAELDWSRARIKNRTAAPQQNLPTQPRRDKHSRRQEKKQSNDVAQANAAVQRLHWIVILRAD